MAEVLKNIRLILAYDGTHYHGWQRQKRGVTIQGVIEEKLQVMVGESVKLLASGRTDAGVHAVNQVCNFKTGSSIKPEAIRKGLNSLLPDDILIKDAEHVPFDFHARYGARSKTYEYRVLNRPAPDIFQRRYVWHVRTGLDIQKMEKCLSFLEGKHDFSAFQSSGSDITDPVRSMTGAAMNAEEGLLRFVFHADGFLRHMVRNIVGTIIEVGLGKTDPERFKVIFDSKDRRLAGVKAPARGLFLMHVQY
ncbi:MAG: tRNA pseudouridine(38-40) synthase TruA [Deltaproteobacteria bacterium]|nr:tRNA pseudouridine(38-40) synthase TruA [Deltaproteobacteria bacterium]